MRILAIDPGEKRLGIAISDPTGTVAQPLAVLKHVSRLVDAASIAGIASQNQVGLILVGIPGDDEGSDTYRGRKALRLAEAIHQQSGVEVQMWDESFSTLEASQARIAMQVSRKKRMGHMDELAATVLLQSYLEANPRDKDVSTQNSP